jgi:deoxyuridine 5'-triphosphate nucleotidohydrolase
MTNLELYSLGVVYAAQKQSHGQKLAKLRESAYDSLKLVRENLGAELVSVAMGLGNCSLSWTKLAESRIEKELSAFPLDKAPMEVIKGICDFNFAESGRYASERPYVQLKVSRRSADFIQLTTGVEANASNISVLSDDLVILEWFDVDALDFMGVVYSKNNYGYSKANEAFSMWRQQVQGITNSKGLNFWFKKTRDDAVSPYKARISDSGFDLTLVEKVDQVGIVEMYTTGIKVYADYGWYFILTPRSSIIKSGYMLANNCGIIDRSYTGEILVPMIKLDPNAPDIECPARLVQIIPTPIVDFDFKQTTSDLDSNRGNKGFGSSGL